MLNLLQKWDKWLKAVVRDDVAYNVVSAFIRFGMVEGITLRRDDKREYTQATREEIEEITDKK